MEKIDKLFVEIEKLLFKSDLDFFLIIENKEKGYTTSRCRNENCASRNAKLIADEWKNKFNA